VSQVLIPANPIYSEGKDEMKRHSIRVCVEIFDKASSENLSLQGFLEEAFFISP